MQDLRDLQSVDAETYRENLLIRRTVERTLHLAVEASLDIGQHIIAREGLRTPDDNKDVFVVLAEEDIISSELLPALVEMAKFRNLIVHDYARVDDRIVHSILQERLGDFEDYARAVLDHLEGV
ncbi:MAG: type VII toxin-antitoxin system HepT family RNase toxin [Anaerolineae bacterium]